MDPAFDDIAPLPDGVEPSQLLHERAYVVRSYRIDNQTLLLRGAVRDQKPAGQYIPDDPEPLTVHHMVDKADAGDVVGQKRVEILADDDAWTLTKRVAAASAALLGEVLPKVKAGNAPRTPQDETKAFTMGGRRPEDGQIDWTKPADEVHNLVRAVAHPWPGAFTHAGAR